MGVNISPNGNREAKGRLQPLDSWEQYMIFLNVLASELLLILVALKKFPKFTQKEETKGRRIHAFSQKSTFTRIIHSNPLVRGDQLKKKNLQSLKKFSLFIMLVNMMLTSKGYTCQDELSMTSALKG